MAILGSPLNFVQNGVVGATIGGGGATNYADVAYSNNVMGDFGTVGGGIQNPLSPAANLQRLAARARQRGQRRLYATVGRRFGKFGDKLRGDSPGRFI